MTFDQPEILNTLIRRVNSFSEGYRQNIALFGDPYAGKTFIIKNLLNSDKFNNDLIIPIYIEIKIEPFDFCVKRFIKSTLFQLLQSDSFLAASHDTVLLIEDLRRTYPKTAQICMRVGQDIDKGKLDDAYSFMMDIPGVIFEESKKRCVLIIDEFQNLGNFTLKNPFGTLAKKIMIQKDTMYFLLSSRNTIAQRILNEKLSLLFGNFEKIILPPLNVPQSRLFLKDNICGAILPHSYMDFIASFSGNRPFYMQAICHEIERALFCKRIPSDDYVQLIESALTEAVFKKTGLLNQHFSSFLYNISEEKLLSKFTAVLIALSFENKKQRDIVKYSKLQSKETAMILNRLLENDVIVRNGSFYRFRDRLFCYWMRFVYIKRIMSFSIDETMEENYFKKEAIARMNIFIEEFQKELSARILDLFTMFKNDVIQLNGRRHKFFSFNNVQKTEENVCSAPNILATSGRSKWLCTIKKDYVTENDIAEIIKDAKHKKHADRINKNILISLTGIDENAYLLAKEAKFWIWDLDSVNILMELYGKPNIDTALK